MFSNNTNFIAENNAFLSKIKQTEPDALRYNQKLPVEFLKHWKNSRGLLLYQQMGSGKTRIGSAIMDNFQKEGYKVIFMASKSLHENAKTEIKKYLTDIGSKDVDEIIKKHYKFISLNASNMIQQVYKAVRQEGEEMFSQVIENMFKKSSVNETDNANFIKDIKKHIEKVNALINLDGCVVVIDEAHDFFNSVVNGSKNATALYYLLLHSQNSKIIFMTGSPIVNDPFEITVPINILGGVVDGETIFGENYDTFYKYFISNPELNLADDDNKQALLKNREKFIDRITGMVSYFGADSPEFLKLLPKQEPVVLRKILMSDKQFSAYAAARDREIEATVNSAKKRRIIVPMNKPKGAGSTYRILSRQISNILYPDYATSLGKNEYGSTIVKKHLDKLDDKVFTVEGLAVYSPKILALMVDLARCLPGMLDNFLAAYKKHFPKVALPELSKAEKGPALIYSQFVESGVGVIAKILEYWGFNFVVIGDVKSVVNGSGSDGLDDVDETGETNSNPSNPNKPGKKQRKTSEQIIKELTSNKSSKPSYAMIMGEIDVEDRKLYEDIMNSDKNQHGELIAVLLVTATAAQGINLFTVTNEFMLEPFWHLSRNEQFFSRAVRPHSLEFLPESKRKVGRYIYFSDYPKNLVDDKNLDVAKIKTIMETEKTTDLTIYGKAVLRKILNMSVLGAVKEGSIDCAANYGKDKNHSCRLCKPTNRQLYGRNLYVDMKNPSPCLPVVNTEVKATRIEIDGNKFAYIKDPLKIFKFNPITEKYQEIDTSHEDYYEVYEHIKKLKK